MRLVCVTILALALTGCRDVPTAPRKVPVPCTPATAHTVDTLRPSGIIVAYCGGARKP